MGEVWLARSLRDGTRVALKILAPHLTHSANEVARFRQEVTLASEIDHPNVVRVHQLLEQEQRLAFTMELLDGRTLTELRGTIRPGLALELAVQISRGLEAIHARGVVHRDLKPSNLMVLGDLERGGTPPVVKILDLGIAKVIDAQTAEALTRTGVVVGTPGYMAPEQIVGEVITPATDVYALGEVLFELVAGKRLFEGEPQEIYRRKLIGDLPPLEVPPGTPEAEAILELLRATLRELPDQRPELADVRLVLESLREEVDPFRDPSSTPTVVAPAARPGPRRLSSLPARADRPGSAVHRASYARMLQLLDTGRPPEAVSIADPAELAPPDTEDAPAAIMIAGPRAAPRRAAREVQFVPPPVHLGVPEPLPEAPTGTGLWWLPLISGLILLAVLAAGWFTR
jgi:serine/threonine-protein kinase